MPTLSAATKGTSQDVLVVRGWGGDAPGIAESFMKAVNDNGCDVLDIAQFVLEGSLMFTFVLRVGDESSMGLMKGLSRCAQEKGLQLDFYFPDHLPENGKNPGEQIAVLSVVSEKEITPTLLCGLDAVLSENGCVIKEIEHREDNKREINMDYNKVEILVAVPQGVMLSGLSVGIPRSKGETSKGLQKVARENGAEMTIRWWDAMNRPNGKSLVVFGLSEELVTCRPLDEVLRESGLDPSAVDKEGKIADQNEAKVVMLKGKSAHVVQKVIDRLQFTPGVRLVCYALKRLGFRLAILTGTGMKKIAEYVKRELDMDYVISREAEVVDGHFTGSYYGELADVRFRKRDLLMLMAEREGIDYRNVILIGEEVMHLKAPRAREIMGLFGPTVYFNCSKMKDFSIVLYLLGFNGSDVRALRRRRSADEIFAPSPEIVEPPAKRFRLQVCAKNREPGQMQRIISPLCKVGNDMEITTISQCSLDDGGMCIGFDVCAGPHDPESMLKEILYVCQQHGYQVLPACPKNTNSPVDLNFSVDLTSKRQEQLATLQNRHVITLVQKPRLTAASLAVLFGLLRKSSSNIARIERLSMNELAALQFTVDLPDHLESVDFNAELVETSKALGIDIAFQRDDVDRWMRRLVVFDMDSTLIQQEVIDELAKYAGVETEVKAITESAMRGEINFAESLQQRVALLQGHNAEDLLNNVKKRLVYTPGAKKLCSTLRKLGYKMAVISGGFLPMAREVQRHLGLDYAFANTLEIDEMTGLLAGRTSGPVVTPHRKRALLATIADIEGCELKQTIAVGDGANDIPMLQAAGLGIAFCAKPKVQAVSEFRINQEDLSTVLFLIGVNEHAADRLKTDSAVEC